MLPLQVKALVVGASHTSPLAGVGLMFAPRFNGALVPEGPRMSFPVIVSPALAMVPKFVLAAALLAEVINVSISAETVRFGMARV